MTACNEKNAIWRSRSINQGNLFEESSTALAPELL